MCVRRSVRHGVSCDENKAPTEMFTSPESLILLLALAEEHTDCMLPSTTAHARVET
jgi:hypothetical protein